MLCKRDICQNIGIKRRYILFFDDNSLAATDPVLPYALVCMRLFGNVYVHAQKRAGDKYQDTIYKIFISHFHSLYISYTNTLTTYVDILVEMGGAT